MLAKKKQGVCCSKNQQSSSKLTKQSNSSRRSYQKHSRKGTKDYQPLALHTLINSKFHASAQQSANRALIYNMNSILAGHTSHFSLQLREAIVLSDRNEQISHYYMLAKHRGEGNMGVRLIENWLVESIQGRGQGQFASKAVMHFPSSVYPIMYQHNLRRKHYLKKLANLHTHSSLQPHPKAWTKELPTLVSEDTRLNSSESFELKKLTDCIKEMFSKQGSVRKESWGAEGSWAGKEKRPLLDCDFSSIQGISKNQLQLDSKMREWGGSQAEENYGLGSLRRKYEEQRLSRLKQNQESEGKTGLGHRRSPTETLQRQDHLFEPLTPKECCKSVFASAQNILPTSPRQGKKSKKKVVEVNEAYLLRFQKKKVVSPGLKENGVRGKSGSKGKQGLKGVGGKLGRK